MSPRQTGAAPMTLSTYRADLATIAAYAALARRLADRGTPSSTKRDHEGRAVCCTFTYKAGRN